MVSVAAYGLFSEDLLGDTNNFLWSWCWYHAIAHCAAEVGGLWNLGGICVGGARLEQTVRRVVGFAVSAAVIYFTSFAEAFEAEEWTTTYLVWGYLGLRAFYLTFIR